MTGSLFLWGLLGLLQITFLPGYLASRALRIRPGVIDGLLLSFCLSTLVNYLVIQFLVFVHLFTRPVLLSFIAVELLVAICIVRPAAASDRWQRSAQAYQGALADWAKLLSLEKIIVMVVGLLAIYCTAALACSATVAWQDEAFTLWDNVMSWNRWATEWFGNKFPWKTYHYPQLLPANSSIVYVLSQTDTVQSFNRLFFAFFPISICVSLLDLGIRRRQLGYWLSIPLIHFAWIFMARPFPAEGYADVPVTFMILMTVYAVFIAEEQREASEKIRWMLVAGLLAGAALVTKQTGAFIVITLPLFLILLVSRGNVLSAIQKRNTIIWAFALALVVSVPWYIIKEVQIRSGADQSEIAASVVAHSGRGLLGRLTNGIQQMFLAWGTTQTVTVAILAIAAAFLRDGWAWVTRLVVLPGFFVWGFTTSYDLRNSNFCVVLGCVSAGLSLGNLLSLGFSAWRAWPEVWRRAAAVACIAILALFLSYFPSVSNATLASRSNQAQKTTAMPEFNAAIFRLIAEHKISRPILTNYWMMFFIPGLKEYMAYDSLTEPPSFQDHLIRTNPEYIAILHPSQNYAAVSNKVVSENVASGLWSIAETGPSFQIIEVHSTPVQTTPTAVPAVLPPEYPVRFGDYTVLSGLSPEEGPYPKLNLPIVRWGLGPASKLEFKVQHDETFELTLEIERPATKLSMQLVLNNVTIGESEIPLDSEIQKLKYKLKPHIGTNQLEIRYSAWDTHSESRPLAVLFRSIQLLPLKP